MCIRSPRDINLMEGTLRYVIFALTLGITCTSANAQNYVNGYVRSDGTYVQPHFRSSPNSTQYDNYSTRGNTNPYTGQRGSSNPYAPGQLQLGTQGNRINLR